MKKARTLAMDKLNLAKRRNVTGPRGVEDAGQERLQPDTRSCRVVPGHKWPRRGVPSKKTVY